MIALSLALAYGVWYAYSVILVALLQEFGWSRSILGGAFSLFAVVHGAANPLLGMLCARVRPPVMMAVGSVALGLAFGPSLGPDHGRHLGRNDMAVRVHGHQKSPAFQGETDAAARRGRAHGTPQAQRLALEIQELFRVHLAADVLDGVQKLPLERSELGHLAC